MPTIEFNKDDLLDLVGEELTDEELETMLTRVKVEVEEIEDDYVEVEVTSDRIDLLSVEGIARNLRSYLGIEPGLSNYELQEDDYEFEVRKVDARPYVVTAVVKGVNITTPALKSIIQLQEKLHGTFGRDRERVSIGIHDMREVRFPLTYKAVDPVEYEFEPLQKEEEMNLQQILDEHPKGQEYGGIIAEYDTWPIIVDDNDNVLSFPPVINSTMTEVNTATRDIFVDVTGTDPEWINYALNVIVTALAERGGDIYQVQMVAPGNRFKTPDFSTDEREVDIEYIQSITGVDLDQEQVREYLEKMGYGAIEVGETLEVVIPPYRADILHDVDIAEDVAIGYGYNNIEPELPDISTIGEEDPLERFMHSVRDLMIGFGYQEVMNPTLTNERVLLELPDRKSDKIVRLENPVSESYNVGRDMLVPQLLETLSRNTHNEYPQKIFEAADVIQQDDSRPVKTRTDKHLGLAYAGKDADYTAVRAELEGLLEALDVGATFEAADEASFIDGRCTVIRLQDRRIGVVGEVHPATLNGHGIEMPVTAAELDLSKLRELRE